MPHHLTSKFHDRFITIEIVVHIEAFSSFHQTKELKHRHPDADVKGTAGLHQKKPQYTSSCTIHLPNTKRILAFCLTILLLLLTNCQTLMRQTRDWEDLNSSNCSSSIGCQFLLEFFQVSWPLAYPSYCHDNLRTFHQTGIIGFKLFY